MQHDAVAEGPQVSRVEGELKQIRALIGLQIGERIEAGFAEVQRIQELKAALQQVGRPERAVTCEQRGIQNARALRARAEVEREDRAVLAEACQRRSRNRRPTARSC